MMVILNELQSQIGFISEPMQQYVAAEDARAGQHGARRGFLLFLLHHHPARRHTIKFCMGTACYVGGVPQLIEKAKQVLGIEPGETTKDGADHPGTVPLRGRMQPGPGDRDR
jgi:NADH-quinone oxidoreductase subunit E